jgi:cobalt-zinc-cadmium efflux system outer membrane protein
VTENEYLVPLTSGHPALVAVSDRLGIARAERRSASLFSNPELDFEREAPKGSARQSTWSVAWAPPLNGRRGLSIQASEAEVGAAEKDLESRLLGLRLQMRSAFASWVVHSQRVEAMSSHLDLVEALAERMTTRADRGEESRFSARRMDLAATEARAELSLMKAELARARATALAWYPELSRSSRPVAPELLQLPEGLNASSRPDLDAYRFELQGAELEERLAGRFIASPRLQFGWQTLEDNGRSFDGPLYGVNWSLPLFSRGQAARLEASQRKLTAKARLEIAVVRAERDLEGLVEAYEELAAAASAASSTSSDLDAVATVAERSYQLGESSVTDLLESLRSVLSTRLSALDLYTGALEAHRNLESAVGRPLTTGGMP